MGTLSSCTFQRSRETKNTHESTLLLEGSYTGQNPTYRTRSFTLLQDHGIRFCVICGQAVNAYVEPLVSLDLDLAIAVDQIEEIRRLMDGRFKTEKFPHSIDVSAAGLTLRVQFQTDSRYGDFVERASIREILGLSLPVASVEDVLQGKIWAALNPERRATQCRKDLLDIERTAGNAPLAES